MLPQVAKTSEANTGEAGFEPHDNMPGREYEQWASQKRRRRPIQLN